MSCLKIESKWKMIQVENARASHNGTRGYLPRPWIVYILLQVRASFECAVRIVRFGSTDPLRFSVAISLENLRKLHEI